MPHASTFEAEKFAAILKTEVRDIASKKYGGKHPAALEQAFARWCIKNISPALKEKDVDSALAVAENGRPRDEHLDGAWIDEKAEALCLLKTQYIEPSIPLTPSQGFNQPMFGAGPAGELISIFKEIRYQFDKHKKGKGELSKLVTYYEDAINDKLRVSLIVAISGGQKKALHDSVDRANSFFRKDHSKYSRHYCSVFGLDRLNQALSDNLATPPGIGYLNVTSSFTLKNPSGTIYAVAATVNAKELMRIRDDWGYTIYHSNFRFLLKRGGVARPKIEETLKDPNERRNFWRYNNGITACCKTVEPTDARGLKFQIDGFQVVNGLQTIETLWENSGKDDWLKDVDLLVRLIPTLTETSKGHDALEEHIAEYSNSQTPITPRNLRANDPVQHEIGRIMSEVYGLHYVRKPGKDPNLKGVPKDEVVDNEECAQSALAFWYGLAREAKSQKRLLFEKKSRTTLGYYDVIFTDYTTAEYVLLPYLLWNNEYEFIYKVRDKTVKSGYRNLDLLAVAVLGEVVMKTYHLQEQPSRSEKIGERLKSVINELRGSKGRKRTEATQRIWRPILESLMSIVEANREIEASKQGLTSAEDISIRNVIVKMRFNDTKLRKQIMRKPKIRRLPKLIVELFGR